MCRLLGLVADTPVDIRYWMQDSDHPFVEMSSEHGHGWGISWYDTKGPHLIKEPVAAEISERFTETFHSVKSNLFLCHIRKATCGEHSVCNSHPFQNQNWFFAHNGSVDGMYLRGCLEPSMLPQLGGETDSEVYFLWLLQNLNKEGEKGFKAALRRVREREFTALNFIMSDGETLYAYWEQSSTAQPPNANYYRLYFTARQFELENPVRYSSEQVDSRQPGPRTAMIVCSEKLDGGGWESLPEGSLLTLSHRQGKHLVDLR